MSIYDQLKDVAKVLREADKIEQFQVILDTQQSLMDMQHKLQSLEEENSELKDKLKLKAKMIYKESTYWVKDNGKVDGPYCSGCFDDKRKAIRLKPVNDWPGEYTCPICKTGFSITSQQRGSVGPQFAEF